MNNISSKELERQYQLNAQFNANLNNSQVIEGLVKLGAPYSSRELYEYGEKNSYIRSNYVCDILRESSSICVKSGNYKTLLLLIDSPEWNENIANIVLYQSINYGVDYQIFRVLLKKLCPKIPSFSLRIGL